VKHNYKNPVKFQKSTRKGQDHI